MTPAESLKQFCLIFDDPVSDAFKQLLKYVFTKLLLPGTKRHMNSKLLVIVLTLAPNLYANAGPCAQFMSSHSGDLDFWNANVGIAAQKRIECSGQSDLSAGACILLGQSKYNDGSRVPFVLFKPYFRGPSDPNRGALVYDAKTFYSEKRSGWITNESLKIQEIARFGSRYPNGDRTESKSFKSELQIDLHSGRLSYLTYQTKGLALVWPDWQLETHLEAFDCHWIP